MKRATADTLFCINILAATRSISIKFPIPMLLAVLTTKRGLFDLKQKSSRYINVDQISQNTLDFCGGFVSFRFDQEHER